MNLPETPKSELDAKLWEKRRAGNVRLGWIVGLIVVLVFLGALWRYRPL